MKIDRHIVPLRDKRTGAIVEALLIDGVSDAHLSAVEQSWMPALVEGLHNLSRAGKPVSAWPQSRHWNWRRKIEQTQSLLAYRGFAVECEGAIQGLMLIKTTEICILPGQEGKPLVYIDFLETAPWNQRELVGSPRFGGIGSVFLAVAINLSMEEGFHGRVGLHSLPQSERFYEACGMANTGHDSLKQNLCYFEMTPQQAAVFLAK